MYRSYVIVVLVMFGTAALSHAEEKLLGTITKIDSAKLSFNPSGAKAFETKEFPLSREIRVYRFTSKTDREIDSDGLKAEPLQNLPKGGVLAQITVSDGKVTEITIPVKKKK